MLKRILVILVLLVALGGCAHYGGYGYDGCAYSRGYGYYGGYGHCGGCGY